MAKVLILGGNGLVGSAIINELINDNDFELYGTYSNNPSTFQEINWFKLDINDTNNIVNILDLVNPQIVISCLRGAFNEQLTLHTVVAKYLEKTLGCLYFCSTTNVFDNDLGQPHYEDSKVDSFTDYGKFKIECERTILEILKENGCILRLPQIWGRNSPRMSSLLKAIENKEEIEVYPNLFCSVNADTHLGKQIHYLVKNGLKGIFHLGTEDILSHKDFYEGLMKKLGYPSTSLKENLVEKGYFALLSNKSEVFPKELRITTLSVINLLTS
jgi:dTDP-4-dehydrorhamnose reductase